MWGAPGARHQSVSAGETYRYRMNFDGGEHLETDLIVFSAGIRPQDALGRGCGLDIAARGGVVIDNHCRSSDPRIFAIGECASWNGSVFGLVAPGYSMARNLAGLLMGEAAVAFTGADMSTKLKLLGWMSVRSAMPTVPRRARAAIASSMKPTALTAVWWWMPAASTCSARCWSVTTAITTPCCSTPRTASPCRPTRQR